MGQSVSTGILKKGLSTTGKFFGHPNYMREDLIEDGSLAAFRLLFPAIIWFPDHH
jgi:hypothetical protein